MLIFITGYMASGKTTLGKRLAADLDYRFLDLDNLIEEYAGKKILKIFTESGEDNFREIERRVLIDHLNDQNTVIATGGGTACYLDNIDLMNSSGLTVFLDVPVEILIERLLKAREMRPLIKNLRDGELESYIRKHLFSRRKFYQKSKLRIENGQYQLLFDWISGRLHSQDF